MISFKRHSLDTVTYKGKLLLLQRSLNFAIALYNYLLWHWRFYSFGWRSRLGRCDMMTNPGAISIGEVVHIRKGARLEAVGSWEGKSPKISIGDGTSIQFYFHCGAAESVTIGKNVLISGRVFISDHDHVFDDPEKPPILCHELRSKPVVIEDGAWLGEGCVILKGVTVGKRAVVGANAVVTKDIAPFSIVAGVPARIIREINQSC